MLVSNDFYRLSYIGYNTVYASQLYVTCITIIDTIILTNYNYDAYTPTLSGIIQRMTKDYCLVTLSARVGVGLWAWVWLWVGVEVGVGVGVEGM
jgi:hypothetical protein